METEILKISKISPDQSIICILGSDKIPEILGLSKIEKEFAVKKLQGKEEYVIINSYYKWTYLIRLKEGVIDYKIREQLRRTAYNLRKLIKENKHTDLVITSYNAYKEAVIDFTEGLLLSFYFIWKIQNQRRDRQRKRVFP